MNRIDYRKVTGSLAISILLVSVQAFAGGDDATNPHKFWGSARTEPGQGIKAARRWDSPTGRLAKEFPLSKYRLYTIDLDQDGRDDYIAESKTEWQTCFIKSDFTIQNCEQMNLALNGGFSYQYFVNLDRSMLYLLDLSGDEDTSDYSLKQFDKKTWKLKKLFTIYPLVNSQSQERSGIYWGYPWDIHSLSTRIKDGIITIQATLDYQAFDTPCDEAEPSVVCEKAEPGVAILFDGIATQGSPTGYYSKLKAKLRFMSLKEIRSRYEGLSSQSPKKKI